MPCRMRIVETIKKRKSVRTFDKKSIDAVVFKAIGTYLDTERKPSRPLWRKGEALSYSCEGKCDG